MGQGCDHSVGFIPHQAVTAKDWNQSLARFVSKVDDFYTRGQRDQINHPGFCKEFNFCPDCGDAIDRVALGLLSYSETFEFHAAAKMTEADIMSNTGSTSSD